MNELTSKRVNVFLGCIGLLALFPVTAAAYAPITFRHQHHLFTMDPDLFPEWRGSRERWTYEGRDIRPVAAWRVDGDDIPALPDGVRREETAAWDTATLRATLERKIARPLRRDAGNVTISRNGTGAIAFQGVGLPGRDLDLDAAVSLTVAALEQGVTDVVLPVTETPPTVTVTDPGLIAQGIREVVTVGESNFAGSPVNRRHNIAVGLGRFNGHLIPQGSTFSFNEILGPVDGSTGYRKELVIKGDRTVPDYGGGLCQVSTTAYRGVWEYGFPILRRKNHSYAVNYYGPQGTDATVYPPDPDMKFKNDGPSALVMQTHQEDDHAYFIYYGTRDTRTADIWGPVVLSTSKVPPDREVFTTELPPGVRRKVGDRHPGITVVWYRTIQPVQGPQTEEEILSIYQARPLFYEVGVAALPTEPPTENEVNAAEPPRPF